jgi:hypothetical protein
MGSPGKAPVRGKLVALGVLLGTALVARVMLIVFSVGSNDAFHWQTFGASIRRVGILQTYENIVIFNHPPLAGYWAAFADWLSSTLHLSFAWVFKLAPFVADLMTAYLLWMLARPRGPVVALGLAAAFLWSPIAILVSCYHANTDPILAGLLLLAALAADAERPFAAGLALAAAFNVKIVAVFAVPVILLRPATWRDRLRTSAAASLAIVPFLPVLFGAGRAFYRNGIAYNSNPDEWGLLHVFWHVSEINRLGPIVESVTAFFAQTGRWMILGLAVLIGIAARGGRRSAVQATTLVLATFLVLAPGFGVQYTVWIVPFLFAVAPLRTAIAYSLTGGIFLSLTYFHFWQGQFPAVSMFNDVYPPGAAIFGFWAWLILGGYLGCGLKTWAWDAKRTLQAGGGLGNFKRQFPTDRLMSECPTERDR